jgi:tetratricopeptide (TPR) repeat protein
MRLALVAALMMLGAPAFAQAPTPTPPRPGARPSTAGMLDALKAAPSDEAAAAIEGQLQAAWAGAASPAIRLLLARGRRELSEGAASDSRDSYDAALEMDSGLLEAWRGRATARLHMGDTVGAVRDLQEVIRREPREFQAWQDLSRIAESRGDWKGALAAWQTLLENDPHTPGGLERLKDLRRRANGEDA